VKKERAGLAFEPGVGGRYYEWDVDGTKVDWGRVLVWEPPFSLAMTWRVRRPLPVDPRRRAGQ
jgi:hypothetical protein